jgi:hypothetical protein
MRQNIWNKLSSGQKLNMLGAALLFVSLFLNWYSDKDVFRSGDSYTALNGPLYFVGLSILLLCVVNAGSQMIGVFKAKSSPAWAESRLGKLQMGMGFTVMYLLMVINSAYFHPQFGLNILSKKSEIGVMLALVATVMICVGGYISFRKKFEKANAEISAREVVAPVAVADENLQPLMQPVPAMAGILARNEQPVQFQAPVRPAEPMPAAAVTATAAARAEQPASHASAAGQPPYTPPDKSQWEKSEYEKTKLYENLRKTMLRDTMTPEKRRKLREKEARENVFSANFGKAPKVLTPATAAAKAADSANVSVDALLRKKAAATAAEAAGKSDSKKPQMYRMDL